MLKNGILHLDKKMYRGSGASEYYPESADSER